MRYQVSLSLPTVPLGENTYYINDCIKSAENILLTKCRKVWSEHFAKVKGRHLYTCKAKWHCFVETAFILVTPESNAHQVAGQ